MKRQILSVCPGYHTTGCCPGHDTYPAETYKSNRSKRARSRDIKKEHRHFRRVMKQRLFTELCDNDHLL